MELPFCLECGAEGTLQVVKKKETIDIKSTPITVEAEVIHCTACGAEFSTFGEAFDYINRARQIYRERYNIPSPEDIRAFMDKYHFSLRDMEKLTGIAFKTIDRYLKGAIPDPSNAKFLATLLHFPEVVLSLMKRETHFSARKFEHTRKLLENEVDEHHALNCPDCRMKKKLKPIFQWEWSDSLRCKSMLNILSEVKFSSCDIRGLFSILIESLAQQDISSIPPVSLGYFVQNKLISSTDIKANYKKIFASQNDYDETESKEEHGEYSVVC